MYAGLLLFNLIRAASGALVEYCLREQQVPTYLQLLISVMVVSALVNTMWISTGGVDEFVEWLGLNSSSSNEEGSTTIPSDHSGSALGLSHHGVRGGSPSLMENVTQSDIERQAYVHLLLPTRLFLTLLSIADRCSVESGGKPHF